MKGKFTIIKDCAKIADNTVIPPNTVVPALALFAGSPGTSSELPLHPTCSPDVCPGRFIEDLPASTPEIVEAQTKQYYTRFQPLPADADISHSLYPFLPFIPVAMPPPRFLHTTTSRSTVFIIVSCRQVVKYQEAQ